MPFRPLFAGGRAWTDEFELSVNLIHIGTYIGILSTINQCFLDSLRPISAPMEVLREFLESSTIHGLNHISTSKVGGMKVTVSK